MKTKAWKNRISFFTHENNHKNVTFRRFDRDDPWWSGVFFFCSFCLKRCSLSTIRNAALMLTRSHVKIRNSLQKRGCRMFPHEILLRHIYTASELRAVADSVLFFLCFHGGVAPDDGYDNLIWEDTEIWTSRKEDVNPSVNPYTI